MFNKKFNLMTAGITCAVLIGSSVIPTFAADKTKLTDVFGDNSDNVDADLPFNAEILGYNSFSSKLISANYIPYDEIFRFENTDWYLNEDGTEIVPVEMDVPENWDCPYGDPVCVGEMDRYLGEDIETGASYLPHLIQDDDGNFVTTEVRDVTSYVPQYIYDGKAVDDIYDYFEEGAVYYEPVYLYSYGMEYIARESIDEFANDSDGYLKDYYDYVFSSEYLKSVDYNHEELPKWYGYYGTELMLRSVGITFPVGDNYENIKVFDNENMTFGQTDTDQHIAKNTLVQRAYIKVTVKDPKITGFKYGYSPEARFLKELCGNDTFDGFTEIYNDYYLKSSDTKEGYVSTWIDLD